MEIKPLDEWTDKARVTYELVLIAVSSIIGYYMYSIFNYYVVTK